MSVAISILYSPFQKILFKLTHTWLNDILNHFQHIAQQFIPNFLYRFATHKNCRGSMQNNLCPVEPAYDFLIDDIPLKKLMI
jgi:hypothetical protein